MEARQGDGRVQMVRQRLGERWVSVQVTVHIGEERNQRAFLIDPDPDRELQASRDVDVTIVVDLGLEERPLEQTIEYGNRDGILRNDGGLGSRWSVIGYRAGR